MRVTSLFGGLVASLAVSVGAQSVPAFEVASIKPSGPDSPPMSLQRQPGRLVTSNASLAFLVGWAFSLDEIRDAVKVGLTIPAEMPDANPFSMTAAGVLTGRRVTMDMLAKALSSQLSAPVQNGTTITGSFDFTLQWQPDGAPIGDVTRPSLFTAIREQLGLRLDVRRALVDVVVIDRLSLIPTPD